MRPSEKQGKYFQRILLTMTKWAAEFLHHGRIAGPVQALPKVNIVFEQMTLCYTAIMKLSLVALGYFQCCLCFEDSPVPSRPRRPLFVTTHLYDLCEVVLLLHE